MNGSDWLNGVSIEKENEIAVYHNESYAQYGDGGEGGDIPRTVINVTTAPNWGGAPNFCVEFKNSGGVLYATALSNVYGYITNPAGARGTLYVECLIVELGIAFSFDASVSLQGEARPNPTQMNLNVMGERRSIRNAQPAGNYTMRTYFTVTGDIVIENQKYSTQRVTIS